VAQTINLILASASPRRLQLLKQVGIEPSATAAPDVDETPKKAELPRAHALRLAVAKADVVAKTHGDAVVLAADTVVALGRRILPKADTADEVAKCLRMLSGRRHMVITAVAVKTGSRMRTRVATTRVSFKRLTDGEIAAYVASGEGIGKAGGYAIQGRADAFVRAINGGYSNVVGLPLFETLALLGSTNGKARA
jgi:septum formation protein